MKVSSFGASNRRYQKTTIVANNPEKEGLLVALVEDLIRTTDSSLYEVRKDKKTKKLTMVSFEAYPAFRVESGDGVLTVYWNAGRSKLPNPMIRGLMK